MHLRKWSDKIGICMKMKTFIYGGKVDLAGIPIPIEVEDARFTQWIFCRWLSAREIACNDCDVGVEKWPMAFIISGITVPYQDGRYIQKILQKNEIA